jgi:hypothetical protein
MSIETLAAAAVPARDASLVGPSCTLGTLPEGEWNAEAGVKAPIARRRIDGP